MKGLIQLSACLTDTTENWPQKNRKKEGGKKKKVIPFKSLKAINFLKKGKNTNKTKQNLPPNNLPAKLTHLWVFTPHVSTHGCSGRNLCPTQLTALGFHLIMSELDVLL